MKRKVVISVILVIVLLGGLSWYAVSMRNDRNNKNENQNVTNLITGTQGEGKLSSEDKDSNADLDDDESKNITSVNIDISSDKKEENNVELDNNKVDESFDISTNDGKELETIEIPDSVIGEDSDDASDVTSGDTSKEDDEIKVDDKDSLQLPLIEDK